MIRHLFEEAAVDLGRLLSSPRMLLALDFDGTLSPIAPTPEEARIHPDARRALEDLSRRRPRIRVAIVSGRPISDLRALTPSVDYRVGLHGLEIQEGEGPIELRFDTGPSDEALERVRAALGPALALGARLEDKGHAIALHVRGLDRPRAHFAIDSFTATVETELRRGAPIEILRGKEVVEARPLAARKHLAVADLLSRVEGSSLLYVGDDTTDEDVFAAFPGALTVVVMDPVRTTYARAYLRAPAEVAELLSRIAASD